MDSFSVLPNRYIDIGAGGPAPFSFKVSSNASWVDISPSSGNVSPQSPEKRIFLSVKDWSSLSNGVNTAAVKVTATSNNQPSMSVTINFSATKAGSVGDFHGIIALLFGVREFLNSANDDRFC